MCTGSASRRRVVQNFIAHRFFIVLVGNLRAFFFSRAAEIGREEHWRVCSGGMEFGLLKNETDGEAREDGAERTAEHRFPYQRQIN